MKPFNYIILFSALLTFNFALAQDKIFTTDGAKIEGKVLEVGIAEIKYKKKDNPDGPTYSMEMSKLLLIEYANGKFDTFNTSREKSKGILPDSLFKRNAIYFNPLPLLYSQIDLGYKHIFAEGTMGFSTNGVYNLEEAYIFNSNSKYLKWSGNVLFHVIPTGQRKIMYEVAIGPSMGQVFAYRYISYLSSTQPNTYLSSRVEESINYIGADLRNAIVVSPVSYFSFSIGLDVGMRRYFLSYRNNKSYSFSELDAYVRPRLDLAFKF
ncbi:MAG: hypothetical protein KDC83_09060 [Flavobacteriales bacterium]|nr:hypothetical protein [Flavobacteriales bacterium]